MLELVLSERLSWLHPADDTRKVTGTTSLLTERVIEVDTLGDGVRVVRALYAHKFQTSYFHNVSVPEEFGFASESLRIFFP